MSVDGSGLIVKIQSMVKVQGRELHRQLGREFASLAEAELRSEDAGSLGSELSLIFDVFRKCRREESSVNWAQNEGELDAGDLLKELIWKETKGGWGKINREQLYSLYIKTNSSLDAILSEFNSSRSRATHVLALFRPFQDRYLSEWSTSVSPYPREQLDSKIASLRGAVINDKIALAIWAEEVFDLFQEAAVFYPERQVIVQKSPEREGKLPLGMISSQSLRIYGQQWRLWIREYENQVLSFQNGEKDNEAGVPLQITMPEASDLGPESQLVGTQSAYFEIELIPGSDESLSAKRTWDDKASAELQLADWIESIGLIWNQLDLPCKARIRASRGINVSELSVKAKNFADMASLAKRVLAGF